MRLRWFAVAGIALAVLLLVLTRPADIEQPDPQLGYTPQGDVHAMLLSERLFSDLTVIFTSPDTPMRELPPYPGSHDSLEEVLDYYHERVEEFRDGRLCLTGSACPERDRIALEGLEALLRHGEALRQMEQDETLDESTLRAFRARAMDVHADTLHALAGTFSGDGSMVFRESALLTRLNALATRAGATDSDQDGIRESAYGTLADGLSRLRQAGVDIGPGGELSRSAVRLRGAQMLDSSTVQPDDLLDLIAYMLGSLAPLSDEQGMALSILDEHLLSHYGETISALRWTMIRQLDPPPASEES